MFMTISTTLMLLPLLSILPMFFKVAAVILVIVVSDLSVDNITMYKTCIYVLMNVTRFLRLHQLKDYLYYQCLQSSVFAVVSQTRQQCLVLGKFLSPYLFYEVSDLKHLLF